MTRDHDGSVTLTAQQYQTVLRALTMAQQAIDEANARAAHAEKLAMNQPRSNPAKRYDWIDHACGLSLIDKLIGR